MEFGLAFANIRPFVEPEAAGHLARTAEAAGFESLWTVDHVVVPADYTSKYPYDPSGRLPTDDAPFTDPLIWMAFVAGQTSRIRLGTGILILPERNPLVLAKELATLDVLSSGRISLGVGIGWLREEYTALGIPLERRGERLEEYVAAMRTLWTEERASFDGVFTGFRDVYLRPQPTAGPVPIHIGGHTELAARRAGRIGDGFFPFGVDREQLPHLVATLRSAAEEAGRDPAAIELTYSTYTTDPDQARAEAEELAEVGITRVVIPAGMFQKDLEGSLGAFGERVIAGR